MYGEKANVPNGRLLKIVEGKSQRKEELAVSKGPAHKRHQQGK
jgi:predicted transcriptional regulator